MTIPANNWCTSCQEACHDHPQICTICGSTLEAPPASDPASRRRSTSSSQIIPGSLHQHLDATSNELREMLVDLRTRVQSLEAQAQASLIVGNQDLWQAVPAEALDPRAAAGNRERPVSKNYLSRIPRVVLEENSSLFHHCHIEVGGDYESSPRTMQAIPAEFGNRAENIDLEHCELIMASPLTGRGGLKQESINSLRNGNKMLFFMRGDGVTFAEKAMMAQEVGACAVVVGNSMESPWPYIMKDSKRQAKSLEIPVVMVKLEDAKNLQARPSPSSISLKIQRQPKECIVCRDEFAVGDKVLQIPTCSHVFHEQCALVWLAKHNTCPYCRLELPTDDTEYENERRRVQRTHAGGSIRHGSEAQTNAFYG